MLNTSNTLDEEFGDSISTNIDAPHIRFAPKETKEAFKLYRKSVNRKDRQSAADAASRAEAAAKQSLSELCGALQNVSPKAAIQLLYGERHDCLYDYMLPKGGEIFSLSRGAWLIGVYGNGTDNSRYGALIAFNKYVRWVAAYLTKLRTATFAELDDTECLASFLPSQLEISRLVEPETRMMWIVDEISASIGRWVDNNLPTVSDLIGSKPMEVAAENIHEAVSSLWSAYSDRKTAIEEPYSATLLKDIPEGLIRALTARRPTALSEASVEEALLGEEPTTTPFVHIEDTTWVLNRSAWLDHRDDVLFRFAMKESPRDKEGQVFEDVTASMLRKWGPREVAWKSSVDLLSPKSRKCKDEIDIFGCSDDIAFIGECKANRLSRNNLSVGVSFETVVLDKAVSQLETRITHWYEGWRPDGINPCKASEAVGFAITFSSYGGMLWQYESLIKEYAPVQHAVIPLHSLIFAMSILDGPQDLKRYLEHREAFITSGAVNHDELEYMLTFIAALKGLKVTIPKNLLDENARILFIQYELDEEGKSIDPRKYSNQQDWKQQFRDDLWDNIKPVTPSLADL